MNRERYEKVKRLAERGATEGERAAARAALDRMRKGSPGVDQEPARQFGATGQFEATEGWMDCLMYAQAMFKIKPSPICKPSGNSATTTDDLFGQSVAQQMKVIWDMQRERGLWRRSHINSDMT